MVLCNNLAPAATIVGIAFVALPEPVANLDGCASLEQRLTDFCGQVDGTVSPSESNRLASRDMLRNGKFKPTGRSKPANEYLLRTVSEGPSGFPRVSPIVDIANYISLRHQVPLSLWDLDRNRAESYNFRLGAAGEQYVFNPTGQTIDLEDLVVGCAVNTEFPEGFPIINPVKDSMATKTNDKTRNVGIAIYAPQSVFSRENVSNLMKELLSLVDSTVVGSVHHHAVLESGECLTLDWIIPSTGNV